MCGSCTRGLYRFRGVTVFPGSEYDSGHDFGFACAADGPCRRHVNDRFPDHDNRKFVNRRKTVNLKQLINKGVEAVSGVYPEREAREMVFAFLEHSIGTRRHTHIVEPEYQVKDADASVAMAAF